MDDVKRAKHRGRSRFIGFRVEDEQKALIEQAAEREGLRISSFIILLLVRFRILPESSTSKLKRRPVPHYSALHGLLGIVNRIGGNCKQLAVHLSDDNGLQRAHVSIIRAAAAITDALKGAAIAGTVNLYRLQEDIMKEGYAFNQAVKAFNSGKPDYTALPALLTAIRNRADSITSSLTVGKGGV